MDARGAIDDLRAITALQQLRGTLEVRNSKASDCDKCRILLGGQRSSDPEKHCASHAEINECEMTTHELPELTSSWCGMVTSGGLYLYTAGGIWNEPQPIYQRLFRSLLLILRRDLRQTETAMIQGLYHSEFWIWKAFIGAFAIAKAGEEDSKLRSDKELQLLRRYFISAIRTWSEVVGVRDWQNAKCSLGSIVWPQDFPGESLAEKLWGEAAFPW